MAECLVLSLLDAAPGRQDELVDWFATTGPGVAARSGAASVQLLRATNPEGGAAPPEYAALWDVDAPRAASVGGLVPPAGGGPVACVGIAVVTAVTLLLAVAADELPSWALCTLASICGGCAGRRHRRGGLKLSDAGALLVQSALPSRGRLRRPWRRVRSEGAAELFVCGRQPRHDAVPATRRPISRRPGVGAIGFEPTDLRDPNAALYQTELRPDRASMAAGRRYDSRRPWRTPTTHLKVPPPR